MQHILFWLYLVNMTLFILHEMDSAYWKEWELFRLPGGVAGFLLIHFPLFLVGSYGVVEVSRGSWVGWVLSLVIGGAGLVAFCLHSYFLWRGRSEFNTPISKTILAIWLVTSLAQIVVTIGMRGALLTGIQ